MAISDYKLLGERIASLRKNAGLSQQDLANKAKVAYSTLAKIERGAIQSPSVFTMLNIAQALGSSIDELMQFRPAHKSIHHTQSVAFLYFDIHGVIATNWERIFTELSSRFHVDPKAIELGFWRYNDIVGRGHMSLDEFEVALARNLRLTVKRLPYREVYFDTMTGNLPVHDLMRELAEHYHIGLLSNIFPGFMSKLIKLGVIPDLPYSANVESCEVGAVKPELPIFDYAAMQASVAPDRIMMVDDTHANLDAAKHLGWQGFWFDEEHPARSVAAMRAQLLPMVSS